jgi:hypothetical protein
LLPGLRFIRGRADWKGDWICGEKNMRDGNIAMRPAGFRDEFKARTQHGEETGTLMRRADTLPRVQAPPSGTFGQTWSNLVKPLFNPVRSGKAHTGNAIYCWFHATRYYRLWLPAAGTRRRTGNSPLAQSNPVKSSQTQSNRKRKFDRQPPMRLESLAIYQAIPNNHYVNKYC